MNMIEILNQISSLDEEKVTEYMNNFAEVIAEKVIEKLNDNYLNTPESHDW